MILTNEEYFKKFPDKDNCWKKYVEPSDKRKDCKCLQYGFMLWTDEPERWAGDYEGGYVAFQCWAYKSPTLKSIKTIREEQLNYIHYNLYAWPYRTIEKYFKKDELLFNNDGHAYGFKCYVGETLCCDSKFTPEQLKYLLTVASIEEIEHYKKQINEPIYEYWDITSPSKEKPYRIYMYGTDDCSYSSLFATKKAMFSALKSLDNNPSWDNLSSLGFVFTN